MDRRFGWAATICSSGRRASSAIDCIASTTKMLINHPSIRRGHNKYTLHWLFSFNGDNKLVNGSNNCGKHEMNEFASELVYLFIVVWLCRQQRWTNASGGKFKLPPVGRCRVISVNPLDALNIHNRHTRHTGSNSISQNYGLVRIIFDW